MSVRILYDSDENVAVFYCSTSCWAFGPVIDPGYFENGSCRSFDPPGIGLAFLRWLKEDPRHFTDPVMERKWSEFIKTGIETCRNCDTVIYVGEHFCSDRCEANYSAEARDV